MEIEGDGVYERENRDALDLIQNFHKRVISYSEDSSSGSENSDDGDAWKGGSSSSSYKRPKTTDLGFKKGEFHTVIKKIKDRPFPRDDGYEDNFQEKLYAKNRSYAKPYMDEQLARLEIMEKDPDYRWVSYLAGATNENVQDLYVEDDLDRQVAERLRTHATIQADIKRTIVPLKEKKTQLKILEEEIEKLKKDMNSTSWLSSVQNWVNKGKLLIEGGTLQYNGKTVKIFGFLKLVQVEEEIRSLSKEPFILEKGFDYNDFVEEYTEFKGKDLNRKDKVSMDLMNSKIKDKSQLHQNIVKVVLIFNYLLDATFEKNLRVIYAKNSKPLKVLFDGEDYRITPKDYDLNKFNLEYNSDWLGLELVWLKPLEDFYSIENIEKMILNGCENVYGKVWLDGNSKKYIYSGFMEEYLIKNTPLNMLSISRGKYNYIQDQPEDVKKILKLLLFNRGQQLPDKLSDQETVIFKELLRAHFIWCYFASSSPLALAYDWEINKKNPTKMKGRLEWTIKFIGKQKKNYTAYLNAYFRSTLLPAMRNPTIVSDNIKLPKEIPEKIKLEGRQPIPENFKTLNKSFNIPQGVIDWISSDSFRNYFNTPTGLGTDKKTPLERLRDSYIVVRNQYPILDAHFLFSTYLNYVTQDKKRKSDQMDELQFSVGQVRFIISEISAEHNAMDGSSSNPNLGRGGGGPSTHPEYKQKKEYVSRVENSGLIRLKAKYVTAMDLAYTNLKLYCPKLAKLPFIFFQSDKANESGLEAAFAAYVAALVLKIAMGNPKTYKSHSQYQAALRQVDNGLYLLKRFNSYGEIEGGIF